MFVITHVQRDAPVEMIQLPCAEEERPVRPRNLCVRAVCCTSHEGMSGVPVHLGARQDAAAAEKTFQLGDATYGVIATAQSDENGWACFANAAAHAGKTCAVWIEADTYTSVDPANGPTACAVTFQDDRHTVVLATLRGTLPLLPADFDAAVNSLLGATTRVRLLVDIGPNLGNQSAALAAILNLRRLGYARPIDALVNTYTPSEQWEITLKFTCLVDATVEGFDAVGKARFDQIQDRLLARYPGSAVTPEVAAPGRRTVKIDSPERDETNPYVMAGGENVRLARCFKDLPFAYTVAVPVWAGEVDPADYRGNTAAGETETLPFTLTIKLDLVTTDEQSVDGKLHTLDPAYDQDGSYANVTWIKKKQDDDRPAFDDDVSADRNIVGVVAGGEYTAESVKKYRASHLKTHSALAIQPLLWHPEERYYHLLGGPVVPLCLPKPAAYFVDPVAPGNARALLVAQLDEATGDALASIIAAVDAGTVDLMTAYGVHQARKSTPATVLANLTGALFKAIADRTVKKTILLVICKEGVELTLVHPKVIRTEADAGLAGKIAALRDDEILFVHTLPMPQRSFLLCAQRSTLPFVLEGANTSNQMQMLGRPYLSVCSETTPYVAVPDHADGHTRLQALTVLLNTAGPEGQVARVAQLATYLGDAKTADTVLDGYFPKLRTYVRRAPLDQVKWGLYRMKKGLDPTAVPSSPICRPT